MTIKTRNILILLFGWAVIFCLLFCSCGERVELNYEKLEAQYVELTPYWNYILKNRLNTDTSARFSVLYKECRDLLEEYKDPARHVSAGGMPNAEGRTDTVILWELRQKLGYAASRTNSIMQNE